jgi:hypothetical protein
MYSRRLATFLWISFAIQIAGGGTAWGSASADCVREAASADLVAKTEFQLDLRNLIVQQRPKFEALATINKELQTLLAEARRAKLDYLLEHDPDRIDTTNGLSRFSDFAWSDEDTAKYIEASGSYRELEIRISTLQERNNDHPDWPKLREYFRSELSQNPEFTALTARFQTQQSYVETAIVQCQRD